jgi:dipeptidyl aminopeptidase/acylaminoacyl peptidase
VRSKLFFVSIVVTAGLCPPAIGSTEGMTARQVAELQSMTAAEISPDGRLIAALRRVPRTLFEDENGPARSELHVIDAETGASRPFVTGEVEVGSVAWAPDGGAISFIAKRGDDEHKAIYSIPADGGEATRIAGFGSDIRSYSWSPDGESLALVAREPKSSENEELEELGFDQQIYEEDWRPLGVWIVRVNDADQVPTRLPLDGSAFQVRWSPTGDRLAVALAPRPLVDDEYMRQRVHVVAADTGEVLGVVDHRAKLGRVEWSPDGSRLAMIAGVDVHDPSESSLWVVDGSGGVPRNLTAGFQGHVSGIAWRDSRSVVFLADIGTATELFTMPSDGSEAARPAGLRQRPTAFTSLDLAGGTARAALIGEAADHPGEVFTLDLPGGEPRRLTVSNRWLGEVRLAPQEVVRYTARDGLELEGILIRPLDTVPGARYPLVLVVHGGPESHYRNGWMTSYSRPGQVLAARGFAVFYPNYRGSTGRGVEFSLTSQGDPAGAEFDDLVDAVDHLVETGLVDRDRVGVTGGSYGGYATAWCATRLTERFAAGVMFVGISNKVSKVGTTDIPDEEFLVHARKRVYDDVPFFLERSPISHAEGARTPLLILHGTDDPRVSVTQSRELYRALKIVGEAPVRLVLYPGEKHGNREAAARYDYSLRLIRWMEHYLNGPGGDPPGYPLDYRSAEHGW